MTVSLLMEVSKTGVLTNSAADVPEEDWIFLGFP